MSHKIAKLMLEHAGTFLDRAEAIRVAISLGMPLSEIEEYLDWLDSTKGRPADTGLPKPDQRPREP
jgi:DNA-binding transcriptional MerR regulator